MVSEEVKRAAERVKGYEEEIAKYGMSRGDFKRLQKQRKSTRRSLLFFILVSPVVPGSLYLYDAFPSLWLGGVTVICLTIYLFFSFLAALEVFYLRYVKNNQVHMISHTQGIGVGLNLLASIPISIAIVVFLIPMLGPILVATICLAIGLIFVLIATYRYWRDRAKE
ncbi:MAG: hypothetical protein CL402_06220 [Acidiferrobacteraceae bacterium]|nr:hypothetical protein [Acidiferrobacteraceae bacterium]|tara:strand:- start:1132 stop:1632 length:501 start_codon:yes stop_codon:yes gene_type:complete